MIYGGTGIYYDQVILNIIGNARFTPPKVIGVQIDNPALPDPFQGGTHGDSAADACRSSIRIW